jgi:hypothetical protein
VLPSSLSAQAFIRSRVPWQRSRRPASTPPPPSQEFIRRSQPPYPPDRLVAGHTHQKRRRQNPVLSLGLRNARPPKNDRSVAVLVGYCGRGVPGLHTATRSTRQRKKGEQEAGIPTFPLFENEPPWDRFWRRGPAKSSVKTPMNPAPPSRPEKWESENLRIPPAPHVGFWRIHI